MNVCEKKRPLSSATVLLWLVTACAGAFLLSFRAEANEGAVRGVQLCINVIGVTVFPFAAVATLL